MKFFKFYKNRKRKANIIASIYLQAVKQARNKYFYENLGIPDTVDGRFDMIILHLLLVIRKLRKRPEETLFLSQGLVDYMFDDMDRNLREMGVGDLSVGKQVKKMAKAFYGRAEYWEDALKNSTESLKNALMDTIYRSSTPDIEQLDTFTNYIISNDKFIKNQQISSILTGNVEFLSLHSKNN